MFPLSVWTTVYNVIKYELHVKAAVSEQMSTVTLKNDFETASHAQWLQSYFLFVCEPGSLILNGIESRNYFPPNRAALSPTLAPLAPTQLLIKYQMTEWWREREGDRGEREIRRWSWETSVLRPMRTTDGLHRAQSSIGFSSAFLRPVAGQQSSRRYWDVSCTSIVLWVETIRVPRAEGRGPPGGTTVKCNDWYRL